MNAADVAGLELMAPLPVLLPGRVVVEDSGPLFGSFNAMGNTVALRLESGATRPFEVLNSLYGDGRFLGNLPEGEYRLSLAGALPSLYRIVSFTYGDVDLLSRPATIRHDDPQELLLRLKTDQPPVRVSGRVGNLRDLRAQYEETGLTPTVYLRGELPTFGFPLEASIKSDGSFEFPRVYPGKHGAYLNLNIAEPASIDVADRNVTNLNLTVRESPPRRRERTIVWRIVVDDGYPAPQFHLSLREGSGQGSRWIPIYQGCCTGRAARTTPASEGEYHVQIDRIPPNYRLKSIRSGTVDLLEQPLVINSRTPEVVLNFQVTDPKEWVPVSGSVRGRENLTTSSSLVASMSGQSNLLDATPVSPDGSWEFPKVLPGDYTAEFRVLKPEANSPAIVRKRMTVSNAGNRLDVHIPAFTRVRGRMVTDSGAPYPCLAILRDDVFIPMQPVCPEPDGSFTMNLPQGEHPLRPWGFPFCYYWIKSITYGSVPFKDHITVTADPQELVVTLGVSRSAPWVTVRGRVVGSRSRSRPPNVLITSFGASFQAPVKVDGSFEFSKVLPGTYEARVVPNDARAVPRVGAPATEFVVSDSPITGLTVRIPDNSPR